MFDKEIVKKILKEKVPKEEWDKYDFEQIVNSYTVVDGFYLFRINTCGFLFTDNELMDCCPGYFELDLDE